MSINASSAPNHDQSRLRNLVNVWIVVLRRNVDAHYHEASKYAETGRKFTAFNSAFAIILALSSVSFEFRTLLNHYFTNVGASVFFLVIGAALLTTTTYQYFVRHSERQYEHKEAAILFSNLRRQLIFLSTVEQISSTEISGVREKYNLIVSASPLIRRKLWNSYSEKYEDEISSGLSS